MNYLTILPVYTIGMFADYSRLQSASDEKPATSNELKLSNEPNLLRGRITHFINEQQTMNNELCSNEPNFAQHTSSIKYPESRFEQILPNEPNLQKTINKQRTMINEQFTNEPNLVLSEIEWIKSNLFHNKGL